MKKFTLVSCSAVITGLLAFVSMASAQITIDYTDLPYAGLKVITEKDSTGLTVTPGNASSSSQNWDFSSLQKQQAATISFMLTSATKYALAFPAANLADSTYGGNGYNFFDTSATSFSAEGAEEIVVADAIPFQIELNLSPVFVQSALPATYGSLVPNSIASGSETFSKTIMFVVSKEMFTDSIVYNDTVDAWGTMKMPNGATYDVLRQKHTEVDYEDVYLYITSWSNYERIVTYKNEYNWYTKGIGYILAEMDMSQHWDTIKDVIWDTSAVAPTGINEISIKNNVNVYPNPANNSITFSLIQNAADGYISVNDITGRELQKIEVKNGNAILSTGSYSNGVYLYNLTDKSGNILDQGKFIVQH